MGRRWQLPCLIVSFLIASFAMAEDKELAKAPAGEAPPKGEVLKFTYENSDIFPGTTREYSVYIPKQYDGSKPACVHVNQDGVQFKAPEVFDRLIHEGAMPVTIGVFVTPGKVKAPIKEALDRFNRSLEYDGLGDSYARFLLDELLPAVETKKASDGRAIKLSKDGNDRSIGGTSSGAIAAWTVAWERPDAFRRVFSGIGTYVGLRGGNNYPTLIRKYEPKPICVFLQDGSKDLNIYGGDWWMANQEMERALVFAGYEVNHVWGEGGHNGQHATELFPDAMRWLWKDHPTAPKIGLGSPQLQEILIPGEDWKTVTGDYKACRGLAVDQQGQVFATSVLLNTNAQGNFIAGTMYQIVDGQAVVSKRNTQASGKCKFGPHGDLIALSEHGKVNAWDGQGNMTKLFDLSAKDLVVLANGNMYLATESLMLVRADQKKLIPAGHVSRYEHPLRNPTGLAVSPDQTLLYAAEGGSHWVHSFVIQNDGSLRYGQRYYHLHQPDQVDDSGAEGMCCDQDGRLYVATRLGLQVCDQAGRVNCIIPTPNGKCSNVTFGGEKFDTIYVTAGDKVYSRKVKTVGARANEKPIVPKPPRL